VVRGKGCGEKELNTVLVRAGTVGEATWSSARPKQRHGEQQSGIKNNDQIPLTIGQLYKYGFPHCYTKITASTEQQFGTKNNYQLPLTNGKGEVAFRIARFLVLRGGGSRAKAGGRLAMGKAHGAACDALFLPSFPFLSFPFLSFPFPSSPSFFPLHLSFLPTFLILFSSLFLLLLTHIRCATTSLPLFPSPPLSTLSYPTPS
jgi:hypothetical protein